jgi:hypothetical protein
MKVLISFPLFYLLKFCNILEETEFNGALILFLVRMPDMLLDKTNQLLLSLSVSLSPKVIILSGCHCRKTSPAVREIDGTEKETGEVQIIRSLHAISILKSKKVIDLTS